MATTNIPEVLTKDIMDKLQLAAASTDIKGDNVLQVVSEPHFRDKSKLLTPPFAGVMYAGMRDNNSDLSGQGLGTEAVVSIIFGFPAVLKHDFEPDAWKALNAARRAIRTQRAPTGHKWRFKSEAYAGFLNDAKGQSIAFYIQTWHTVVAITGW